MKILIRDSAGVRPLEEGFASEEELQTFLRKHSDLMPLEEIGTEIAPLLCIGWEVGVVSGAEDILYVDANGLLTVVETKLGKNPEAKREVVGQILEYAAQMSTWTSSVVERQAEKFFAGSYSAPEFSGASLRKALELHTEQHELEAGFSYEQFLEEVQTNIDQGRFRLIIAIDEPPEPLLKTVEFVNHFSEHFEMYLVQLKRFHDLATQLDIFVPALLGKVATVKRHEAWDWAKYRMKLGWSPDQVERSKELVEKFQQITQNWQSEFRFHQGWVSVHCFGREAFGLGVSKGRGLHLWFKSDPSRPISPPTGVRAEQTSSYLYLSGNVFSIPDDDLRRMSEASLRQLGLEPPSYE